MTQFVGTYDKTSPGGEFGVELRGDGTLSEWSMSNTAEKWPGTWAQTGDSIELVVGPYVTRLRAPYSAKTDAYLEGDEFEGNALRGTVRMQLRV